MTNKTYKLIDGYYSWEQVTTTVLEYPVHTDIRVGMDMVPKIPSNFKKIHADYDGQKTDYGFSLLDKRGIHIKVYDNYYKVHWDKRSSLTDPLGHLYHDALHWFALLVGVVVIGLGVGAYYGYKKLKKTKSESDNELQETYL